MGIYLNDAELLALSTCSGLAVKAYLRLRSRMDLATCLVGLKSGLSWQALVEWTETLTPKGAGWQIEKATVSALRRATEALERAGLLRKKAAQVLVFLCPMATAGNARPNQTRQEPGRGFSTIPDRAEIQHLQGFAGVFEVEPDSPEKWHEAPNPTNIGDQGLYPPQPSSTDLTGVDVGFGENAGGLNRDRATPSQACPLGRTGDYEEGVYRDRAAPSHAGQLSQPGKTHTNPDRDRAAPSEAGSPAHPLGTSAGAGAGERPGGLAENESAPPSALSASTPGIGTLIEVLNRRAVRVPTKPDVLQGWVAMGVTALELDLAIERALAERVKAGSQQRLNVGYVASIIQTARSEARRAAQVAREAVSGASRKRFDAMADLEAMAKQLGIPRSRPGESPEAFRARVLSAAEQSFGTADDVWGAR
ncbi:MAG: hypothetical protein PHE83_15150 [Opitutaceae bacterium]|nr:hypothetical protein [Opitutaceae bacterium]